MIKYDVKFKEIRKYDSVKKKVVEYGNTRTVQVAIMDKMVSPERVFRSEFGNEKKVEIITITRAKEEKKDN